MNATMRLSCGVWLAAMLAGCTSATSKPEAVAHMIQPQRVTEHRGHDDLLTAGLGLNGLRAMAAPAFADPAHPTAAELRRRVTSPNGTTQAAIESFERDGFRDTVARAVHAARTRGAELAADNDGANR